MRILFLSYYFSGPLGAMAAWLAERKENQVVFASSRSRKELDPRNMQMVALPTYSGDGGDDPDWCDLWEDAIRTAKAAKSPLELVLKSGFEPDIICCSSSDGAAFGLRQIFQNSFIVNFLEDTAHFRQEQTGMRQSLQAVQMLEANMTFAFNEGTRNAYAPALRNLIHLAPPVIDCSFFSPSAAKPISGWRHRELARQLITVFAGGLTEQELFHLWHAMLLILADNKHCQIIFIAQSAYELKRFGMLKLDPALADRLFLESHLCQDALRNLLCASSLGLFIGKVAPFGLLECMSCATTPMCGQGRYFLKNGWDMLELSGTRSEEIAENVLQALKKPELLQATGQRARQTTLVNFAAETVMPRFFPEIEKACQEWNS